MSLPKFAIDLLEMLPVAEPRQWEYKSAIVLTQKQELKEQLGKQVSAFANTGGGRLVFGIHPKKHELEPCEQLHGNQKMEDYLAQLVSESVDDPIKEFEVCRLEFSATDSRCIYVVEIGDSPTAPHQSRWDRTYYWRLATKSEPAPHFHLKNLQHRMTECVIEAQIGELKMHQYSDQEMWVGTPIVVTNQSRILAKPFGISLTISDAASEWWKITDDPKSGFEYGRDKRTFNKDFLFPSEQHTFVVYLIGSTVGQPFMSSIERRFLTIWRKLEIELRCFTQNYAGPVLHVNADLFGEAGRNEISRATIAWASSR